MNVDLRRLFRRAGEQRQWLLRVHLVAIVLAIAVVLLLPRWYTSSVTLVPAPRDGLSLDLAGLGGALSAPSLTLGSGPTPQEQLRMVVTSRAVADSIVEGFDLVRRWKVHGRDRARERLADRTTVITPREGQVVVAVEARTPEWARDLAQAYAGHTAREANRLRTSLAAQRRSYLEARLVELEGEIELASGRVREFEERHGAVALPEQTRETMDAAGTLQAQVALLETELAAARRYFTDQAPAVEVLRERIAALNRQIERLARQGGTLLLKGEELPALKQQYLRLSREQMSLTAVLELLRRAYEQARVEEANPVPSFAILDNAERPERHSRPRRTLTVVLAMILTSALSLGYLLWQEGRQEKPVPELLGAPQAGEGAAPGEWRAA